MSTLSPACRARRGRRARATRDGTGSRARPRRAAGSPRACRTSETAGQIAYSAKPPCAPFGIATTRRPCHSLGAVAARVDDAHHFHARAVRQLGAHHHVPAGDAFEVVEVERDGLHANPAARRPRASGRTVSSRSTSVGRPYSWVRHARIVRSSFGICSPAGSDVERCACASEIALLADREEDSMLPQASSTRSRVRWATGVLLIGLVATACGGNHTNGATPATGGSTVTTTTGAASRLPKFGTRWFRRAVPALRRVRRPTV